MRLLKNPMTNAFYLVFVTTLYAAVFIVSSEFTGNYVVLLSKSSWAAFIENGNLRYIGVGMIGIAIVVDVISALRRRKYDEYQVGILEKVIVFSGIFAVIFFPLAAVILIWLPSYFVETIFVLVILQWFITIIAEAAYLFKNYKN